MAATASSTTPAPSTRQRSTDLVAAAQGLTGIAALALGLTYAIGASLRAGELREAGVDVRDGLAVVPIEQLLTRGIDALLDPRNVILFAALFLLGVIGAASGWAVKTRLEAYEAQINADIGELRARLSSAATADPAERARMEERLDDERRWREAQLSDLRTAAENAPKRAQAGSAIMAGGVLVIVVLGFVPVVYALAVVIGVTLLALLALLVWRAGSPPSALALFAGLLIVVASGIMLEGQLNPRPPAEVTLTLKTAPAGVAEAFVDDVDDRAVSGRLVAVTDQGWHLTTEDPDDADKMLTVARDEVAAGVTTRVPRDVESIVETVWDWAAN